MSLRLLLLWLAVGSSGVAADTYIAIVGGLSGEERYEESFRSAVSDIAERSRGLVVDDSNVRVLDGANATRESMHAMFVALAADVTQDDQLVVVLVGHGTHDGTRYKYNIPGPDVTDTELDEWLDEIRGERQLVVLTTSASGGALSTLEDDHRLVITATKNGNERNATVFGRYWIEALSLSVADTDKNDVVSAAEAFAYTASRVAEHYSTRDRLATEHPRMEGDGANRFVVARLKPRKQYPDHPQLTALMRKRSELEDAVERLRDRKSDMGLESYMRLLQDVLLQLASVYDEIERYESEDDERATDGD